MYSSELQFNKTNSSDTKAVFLDLHFCVSNDIVSNKFTIMAVLIMKLLVSHF